MQDVLGTTDFVCHLLQHLDRTRAAQVEHAPTTAYTRMSAEASNILLAPLAWAHRMLRMS